MNYGVVAEFNPFHKGHKYLVDTLKENGANTVTAVMSESFVQRGECACISPYERVKMALGNGVDLVLSLPVQYATSSAEFFGNAGVTILGSLGVIDSLGFGAECNSADSLKECAQIITGDEIKPYLEKRLSEGNSFPKARQYALEDMGEEECARILSTPNNILGVEYIKSVLKNEFPMDFKPVVRIGASHDSQDLSDDICSASAIREIMKNEGEFRAFLPEESFRILKENIEKQKAPADYRKLENAVIYKLRTMNVEDFRNLPDVSEGLENRLFNAVRSSNSLDEILEKVKTKRYTHSRLRRIILCAFLGIAKSDLLMPVPYIRVLGFSSKGASLLKEAKEKSLLPIVTRASDIKSLGEDAKRTFFLECTARDLFSLALPVPDECGKEMTDKIIVL